MNRTLMLCHALGWQGGTIHQVAEETGCEVNELLYKEPSFDSSDDHIDYEYGIKRIMVCDLTETTIRLFRGQIHFWLGVAEGQRIKESQ